MKINDKQLKISILLGILCFLLGASLTYFLIPIPQVISTSDRGYFSHLHPEFQKAQKSIHIVMFQMRYYPEYEGGEANLLLQDLIKAKQKGLDVRVILEGGDDFLGGDFIAKQKKACLYLQNSGVEVKFDPGGITTHAKLVVIDNKRVFLGSTNWNYYSLEHNKETSAFIKDKSAAKKYEDYFQNLWRISKKAECEILPWENCSSIPEILSRRYDCDKKTVSINGTVSRIKLKTSQAGNNYATFKLTFQEKTLKVFTFGHPDITEGNEVEVTGTYFKEKTVSGYQYYDEVEAEEIGKI